MSMTAGSSCAIYDRPSFPPSPVLRVSISKSSTASVDAFTRTPSPRSRHVIVLRLGYNPGNAKVYGRHEVTSETHSFHYVTLSLGAIRFCGPGRWPSFEQLAPGLPRETYRRFQSGMAELCVHGGDIFNMLILTHCRLRGHPTSPKRVVSAQRA